VSDIGFTDLRWASGHTAGQRILVSTLCDVYRARMASVRTGEAPYGMPIDRFGPDRDEQHAVFDDDRLTGRERAAHQEEIGLGDVSRIAHFADGQGLWQRKRPCPAPRAICSKSASGRHLARQH
jgi:hypothetical protein